MSHDRCHGVQRCELKKKDVVWVWKYGQVPTDTSRVMSVRGFAWPGFSKPAMSLVAVMSKWRR